MHTEEDGRMRGNFKIKSYEERFKNLPVLDEVFKEPGKLFLCSQKIVIYQRVGFVSYDFKG